MLQMHFTSGTCDWDYKMHATLDYTYIPIIQAGAPSRGEELDGDPSILVFLATKIPSFLVFSKYRLSNSFLRSLNSEEINTALMN